VDLRLRRPGSGHDGELPGHEGQAYGAFVTTLAA
jgi:hypothetical protein